MWLRGRRMPCSRTVFWEESENVYFYDGLKCRLCWHVQWRWLEMNAFTAIRTNEAYLKLERLSSTGPRIALRIRNKTVGIN